ncbi:MAG: acetylornithine deacetylase [Desulfobulbus propionicus]|nr:MAG: acetylornithine deacetylase [Desulfobulbus propionicus]
MDVGLCNELIEQVARTVLVDRLKEMVSIKSENPFDEAPREGYREKEMGEYLAEQMSSLGMEVTTKEILPGRSNVFGRLKGTGMGPTLMMAGHMDTARSDGYAEAYDVKEKEGLVYGRGSCDMKAAFSAYLEVVRLLQGSSIRMKGDLIIAGIVDEEYQMLGSQDIGKYGPWADQGVIGEPTDLTVCPANKGRVSTFIRTFGRAAHSSVPEQGENAIAHMAKVIQAFADYNDMLLKQVPHPLCGHGRFNPGVIKGGVQVNMVPDCCSLEVDRRTLPGETKEDVYAEFRLRLDQVTSKNQVVRYEITEPSWLIPPNDIAVDEPVVQTLLKAYKRVIGKDTKVTAFVAGSDAPHMGFPTVVCGPGSIHQAHSTCEFVAVDQVVKATQMYLWTAMELLT